MNSTLNGPFVMHKRNNARGGSTLPTPSGKILPQKNKITAFA